MAQEKLQNILAASVGADISTESMLLTPYGFDFNTILRKINLHRQRKPNLHAGLVILSKALVVVHVPLQRLLGVLSDLALLIIVPLLLGCFVPAGPTLRSIATLTELH